MITIRVLGTGINDFYQAKVQIYYNDSLINEGTTYNGIITFCLDKNKVYKIVTILNNNKKVTNIYNNTDYYVINNCIVRNNSNERIITFLLTDYNYNLPIMKGELTFD